MTCSFVSMENGTAVICGGRTRRRKCRFCGHPADLLCDYEGLNRKGRLVTCSAPMCAACGQSIGNDLDLCPPHFGAWLKKDRQLPDPAVQKTLPFAADL